MINWGNNGVFCWHPTVGLGKLALAKGFKWMAVLGYDESSTTEHTPNAPYWNVEFFSRDKPILQNLGLGIALWANPRENMEACSVAIKDLHASYKFEGLILDCEFEFKYSPVEGELSAERFGRANRLADGLKDLAIPKAVSCLGDGSDIDYLAFYGYRFMPQAYSNEGVALAAPYCVNRLNFPPLIVGWRYLADFTNNTGPARRIVKIIGEDSKGLVIKDGPNRWGVRQSRTIFNRNKIDSATGQYLVVGTLRGFCPTSYIHPTLPSYIGMETGRRTDPVALANEKKGALQITKNTGVSAYLLETATDDELSIIGS